MRACGNKLANCRIKGMADSKKGIHRNSNGDLLPPYKMAPVGTLISRKGRKKGEKNGSPRTPKKSSGKALPQSQMPPTLLNIALKKGKDIETLFLDDSIALAKVGSGYQLIALGNAKLTIHNHPVTSQFDMRDERRDEEETIEDNSSDENE